MKKLLIFDLDGTLSDSSAGVIHCYKKTCEKFGVKNVPEEEFRKGLGGPFAENLLRITGLPKERLREAVDYYVSVFASEGFGMCRGFPGIRETLENLRSQGYRMCVATLMADDFTGKFLGKLGIDGLFDSVRSANVSVPVTKKELILKCLEDAGTAGKDAVMIGDSADDMESAAEAGLGFIAAAYGYGLPESVCIEKGIKYVKKPEDLLGILRE